jgi:hypothetical protein
MVVAVIYNNDTWGGEGERNITKKMAVLVVGLLKLITTTWWESERDVVGRGGPYAAL